MLCAFGLSLVICVRVCQLSVRKYRRSVGVRSIFDAQNQVMLLTMIGTVLLGMGMVDYLGVENVSGLSILVSYTIWNVGLDVSLLACARLVHIFVSV